MRSPPSTPRHVLQRCLALHGSQAEHSRAVHVVALPDCEVDDLFESPGFPRSLLIDRHDLKQAFLKLRQGLERHGQGSAPLSPSGANEIYALLSGPNLAPLGWVVSTANSLTARSTTAVSRLARSASNNASRARPTRSSLSPSTPAAVSPSRPGP